MLLVLRAFFPAPVPLHKILSRVESKPQPVSVIPAGDRSALSSRLGGWLTRILNQSGMKLESIQTDLALTGRPLERHVADKCLMALGGLALPGLLVVVAAAVGVGIPVGIPVAGSLLFAFLGFVVPDLSLRSNARIYREDFRHGIGAFLDLVVVLLAGGSGPEGALKDAADVGSSSAFAHLRHALRTVRLNQPPWSRLGRLGEELDIPELVELSGTLRLAGSEGARVRASLITKARTLRAHELADAEAAAGSATEKMGAPVALMFFGFLVFIGYPAVERVLHGF